MSGKSTNVAEICKPEKPVATVKQQKKKSGNGKQKQKQKPKRNMQNATEPWGKQKPTIPGGITRRTGGDNYSFVVGKVNGTPDDWGCQISIPLNPRCLAVQAESPRLRVTSSMYQKYKLKSITVEATPLVSSAGVAGTMLLVSEGGSANSPTPPENVNTCKERKGAYCGLGEKLKYTYVPPQRTYLCRPDGDVSETTPGFMFCSTYLPTTSVLSAAAYGGPLWIISAVANYEFSVFEDPEKNIEDTIVSEPLSGQLVLQQDEAGSPILTGPSVSMLGGRLKPHNVGMKAKNGILLATGIISTAADAIPGPLGILMKAGAAIVKFITARVPSSGEVSNVAETPALQIYGSVDDALESRPLVAPGLATTNLTSQGALTTVTVGQNPITVASGGANVDIDVANIHAPTADKCYIACLPMVQDYPKWTDATDSARVVKIDNLGSYTVSIEHVINKNKFTRMKIIMTNPDGNIFYEGPIEKCPSNGTYNGKRSILWVIKQTNTPGVTDATGEPTTYIVGYDFVAGQYFTAKAGTTGSTSLAHFWNGYSGTPKSIFPL